MKHYKIVISEQANEDIEDLSDAIMYEYKSYRTAIKYIDELYDKIQSLRIAAEAYQLQTRPYFRRYGFFVYRINYKKMAVIYTIYRDIVLIQRVIPASLITE